jgi:hypothetical protein
MAHYCAMDALGFSEREAFEVGRTVGPRIHGAMLNTLVRLAGTLGVGPVTVLKQATKLWSRTFRGGGVAAFRTGERSARVEVRRAAMAQSKFLRDSFAGVTAAGLEPFCKRPTLEEKTEARKADSFTYGITWER